MRLREGVDGVFARIAVVVETAVGELQARRQEAARRRLGGLIGGDEGADLVDESDHWMAEQDVADQERLAEVILPGWSES